MLGELFTDNASSKSSYIPRNLYGLGEVNEGAGGSIDRWPQSTLAALPLHCTFDYSNMYPGNNNEVLKEDLLQLSSHFAPRRAQREPIRFGSK